MSTPFHVVRIGLFVALSYLCLQAQVVAQEADQNAVVMFVGDSSDVVSDLPCQCSAEAVQCDAYKCIPRTCPSDDSGWWFTTDYLHWWMDGDHVPGLLTSSPFGTDRADAGVLGLPTTTALFGNDEVGDDDRPGVRLSIGHWLQAQETALSVELFWIAEDDESFSRFSDGDPALARPFFNTDPAVDAEDAELVAFDDPTLGDELDGRLNIDRESETYSAAVTMQHLVNSVGCRDRGYCVYVVGGYRFFRLEEGLRISESLLVTGGGSTATPGTRIDIFDAFDTSNEFHGGDLGLRTRAHHGCWSLDLLTKVGVGNSRQTVDIAGATTVTDPVLPSVTRTGGLLAQSTNSGSSEFDEFAVLPELQVNLGYQLGRRTRIRAGYSLLFLSDVSRPGSVIDRSVDGRFLDPLAPPFTPTNPVVNVDSTSVWLQGVNLGLELAF